MNLEECLPAELRGPATTITRVSAGLSGAGVYRVEAAGQAYVLKVSDAMEAVETWRRTLHIRQLASEAGVAPRVVHSDEARRAVVSSFVEDRAFATFYHTPHTNDAAVSLLARTLRRVHQLPLPPNARVGDPRHHLGHVWSGALAGFRVPQFAENVIRGLLSCDPPAPERATTLCHNDVNPSNLVFDGESLLLLDWETAGPNDPLYDLATVSMFFRMDKAECRRLLSEYDGVPVSQLPDRFGYNQRLVAALCGAMFLSLARQGGHPGAASEDTIDTALSLGECYQEMRSGALNPATADGQWRFGLALLKTSSEY